MEKKLLRIGLALVCLGLALVLVAVMVPTHGVAAADNGDSGSILTATTYASALIGKLLMIIDGVLGNYVSCETTGNATTPVYVISGLTDEGQTLVKILGDLIVKYAQKALVDLEEAPVNSIGS
jgi:hypothetical protein